MGNSYSSFPVILDKKPLIFIAVPIRDSQKISRIVSDFEPEIEFLLTAQPIILDSYGDPRSTF